MALALLFPAPVTFGLGQVLERVETAMAHVLQDTPWLEWLPLREVELQPLLPVSEILCVAIGLLLPCLLAFGVLRLWGQRMVAAALLVGAGVCWPVPCRPRSPMALPTPGTGSATRC
jgi:hypothetical protein